MLQCLPNKHQQQHTSHQLFLLLITSGNNSCLAYGFHEFDCAQYEPKDALLLMPLLVAILSHTASALHFACAVKAGQHHQAHPQ
jgi:hypothetical protein